LILISFFSLLKPKIEISNKVISNEVISKNQQEKKDDDDIEKIINNIKEKEKSIEKLKLQINYLQLVKEETKLINFKLQLEESIRDNNKK